MLFPILLLPTSRTFREIGRFSKDFNLLPAKLSTRTLGGSSGTCVSSKSSSIRGAKSSFLETHSWIVFISWMPFTPSNSSRFAETNLNSLCFSDKLLS